MVSTRPVWSDYNGRFLPARVDRAMGLHMPLSSMGLAPKNVWVDLRLGYPGPFSLFFVGSFLFPPKFRKKEPFSVLSPSTTAQGLPRNPGVCSTAERRRLLSLSRPVLHFLSFLASLRIRLVKKEEIKKRKILQRTPYEETRWNITLCNMK